MIKAKFTPKVSYFPTQPPSSMGGDEAISPTREFFSYSDTDYEYLIYRTKDKDSFSLKNRSNLVDRYHREEPSEDNNFNLGGEDEYQTLFDDDNLLFDFPDEFDAFLNPGFFPSEIVSFFNVEIFERFFSTNSHADMSLYYFLSCYFYFSEYLWPCVQLYFPILDYLTLTFTFGWDSFLEHNMFSCFFVLYLPFFVYFFLFWLYGKNNKFGAYFNMFRLFSCFFVIFFFCLFFPVYGITFFLFLPALALSTFFIFYFPYFGSSSFDTHSDDFYANYTKFMLPLPPNKDVKYLPLFKYSYPYFPAAPTRIFSQRPRFTRFPFFNISSISAHNKRIKSVFNYISCNNLFSSRPLPHNFSYLQPSNISGFLFEHLPLGFGYSAESHVMLEGFEKDSNIEFDNESGLRPDNYTTEFMTNELGVSNVRFFLSESYHPPLHYSANFNGSSDFLDSYSPAAFSQQAQSSFGPYYSLSIWLNLIRPASLNNLFSNSFDSSFQIPPIAINTGNFFYNKSTKKSFEPKFVTNFEDHIFVKQIYLIFFNFFYSFLHYIFLCVLGSYRYRFSQANPVMVTFSDFYFLFSYSYPRSALFREFFRFIIFINKNYKSKKLDLKSPGLFLAFFELLEFLHKFEIFYSKGFLRFFFYRRLRYVRLCRLMLCRLLKDLS